MDKPNVLILLAAYNGKDFIRDMIDSVLAQDYQNLCLIVSDDCSTDGTAEILGQYAVDYPEKVQHYCSGMRFGCAQKHFMHLLSLFHDAPYIMFCDQDDIWYSDKVSKTLELMQCIEMDRKTPALVHTDLRVVDRNLNELAPSFCANSAIDGRRLSFNHLLVQNVVTGCTVMINQTLARLAVRTSDTQDMLMHDWWLALLASACGNCAFLPESTIDYRQHGSNSVGARNVYSVRYLLNRLCSSGMRRSMNDAALQAQAFLNVYQDILDEYQIDLLCAFISTRGKNVFVRDWIYLKHGLLKNGWIRMVAQLLGL